MGENSEKLHRLLMDFLETEKKFKEAIEKTKERILICTNFLEIVLFNVLNLQRKFSGNF